MIKISSSVALFFILLLSCLCSFAADIEASVSAFELNNGMRFLVIEDHSIPSVTSHIFWKVGSRNEAPGTTGIAHFFEHMMFNGAKRYGAKQFDKVMEGNGGSNNAYTSENVTVYTNWFPKSALATVFDLESDRVENLDISPAITESERQVVTSERRTGLENSNFRALHEEVKGAAFRAHPYSWPVIGHESDIANWRLEELQAFHKTFYAPNNALAVIAGDVTAVEVEALAKRYFGSIPSQAPPPEIRTIEPPQLGERRAHLYKASVTSPNLLIAHHVPASGHPDIYAIDLLLDILSAGRSSRLYQRLVDQEALATEVWAYRPDSFDPNLVYVYAVATSDASAEALEQAIVDELKTLKTILIDERELEKAKNQRRVGIYHALATIDGKAELLGTHEVFYGGYKNALTLDEHYARVTREDIQRVANDYLAKANRTVGVLSSTKDVD